MAPVRCPTCKRIVNSQSQLRPFCCERCKLIDLGRWLDGSYAIPGEPVSEQEPEQELLEDLPLEDLLEDDAPKPGSRN